MRQQVAIREAAEHQFVIAVEQVTRRNDCVTLPLTLIHPSGGGIKPAAPSFSLKDEPK